jgi:hypothetical protein
MSMSEDSTPNLDKYIRAQDIAFLTQGGLWREVRLKEPYQAISDYTDIEVQARKDRGALINELKSLFGEESPEMRNIERAHKEYEDKKEMELIGYCTQVLLYAHHEAYLRSDEAKRKTAEGKGAEGEGGVLDASELLKNDRWFEAFDSILKIAINDWRSSIEYIKSNITTLYCLAMHEGLRVEESVIKPLTDRILGMVDHNGRYSFWREFVWGEYLDHVGKPKSYWVEQVLGDEL